MFAPASAPRTGTRRRRKEFYYPEGYSESMFVLFSTTKLCYLWRTCTASGSTWLKVSSPFAYSFRGWREEIIQLITPGFLRGRAATVLLVCKPVNFSWKCCLRSCFLLLDGKIPVHRLSLYSSVVLVCCVFFPMRGFQNGRVCLFCRSFSIIEHTGVTGKYRPANQPIRARDFTGSSSRHLIISTY